VGKRRPNGKWLPERHPDALWMALQRRREQERPIAVRGRSRGAGRR
jgi:hypothetical protein